MIDIVKVFRIVTVALLAFWTGLIFFFSAQNATTSSATSAELLSFLCKIFVSDFEAIPAYSRQILIDNYQFLIRKAAHFSIFFFLGVFAFLSIVSYPKLRYRLRILFSMLFCLLNAASDEFHQFFVPGRGSQLRDVLIDCSGAFLAVLLMAFLFRAIKPLYQRVKYCGKTE